MIKMWGQGYWRMIFHFSLLEVPNPFSRDTGVLQTVISMWGRGYWRILRYHRPLPTIRPPHPLPWHPFPHGNHLTFSLSQESLVKWKHKEGGKSLPENIQAPPGRDRLNQLHLGAMQLCQHQGGGSKRLKRWTAVFWFGLVGCGRVCLKVKKLSDPWSHLICLVSIMCAKEQYDGQYETQSNR